MKCWWIFFHKWTKWSNPYLVDNLNTASKISIQDSYCEKCNKAKWRVP